MTRTMKRELNEELKRYLTNDMEKELKRLLKVKKLDTIELYHNKRYILNNVKDIRFKRHLEFMFKIFSYKI